MVTILRGSFYPSVEPLAKLSPICLRDLKLEAHHRGSTPVSRSYSDPFRTPAGQIAIEDEHGHVDYLAVLTLTPATPIENVLPKNGIMIVKERYYKLSVDGGAVIQVNHPQISSSSM